MEILTYTFVQHAFLAGIMTALVAGILGPMVVSSRQSVASDMLAHVALAGVGLAAVLDMLPLAGAFAVLVASSVLLWWFITKEMYATDALSMLFLSGGLAIALALIHIARDQTVSFENYLFGSILTVTSTELLLMATLTALSLGLITLLWYPLLSVIQTPAYRLPYSKRPQFMQLVFFMLIALVVWIGLKTVGGLLIGALLVIPTLAARHVAHSFLHLTIITTLISVVGTITGLCISLVVDIPPSSAIIFTLIGLFILSGIIHRLSR